MRPFVLLTFPRTGSTFVRIWLHSHPQIRSHGEVFLPHYNHADGFRWHCREKYALGRLRHGLYSSSLLRRLGLAGVPASYVDDFLDRFFMDSQFPGPWMYDTNDGVAANHKAQWGGFKLMYHHLWSTRRLSQRIVDDQYAILHLTRENLLKQYVSLCRMNSSNVSHSTNDSYKAAPVYIDTQSMLKHFGKISSYVDSMRKRYSDSRQYFEFSYEEFFTDPDSVGDRIIDFFRVDTVRMKAAKLKKTSTNSMEAEIENAEDVRNALEGTRYQFYLEAYS